MFGTVQSIKSFMDKRTALSFLYTNNQLKIIPLDNINVSPAVFHFDLTSVTNVDICINDRANDGHTLLQYKKSTNQIERYILQLNPTDCSDFSKQFVCPNTSKTDFCRADFIKTGANACTPAASATCPPGQTKFVNEMCIPCMDPYCTDCDN